MFLPNGFLYRCRLALKGLGCGETCLRLDAVVPKKAAAKISLTTEFNTEI